MFGGVEYFFGQGIMRKVQGTTHHGIPIEKLHMGSTELPQEVIEEYLESMAEVYTPEVSKEYHFYHIPLRTNLETDSCIYTVVRLVST